MRVPAYWKQKRASEVLNGKRFSLVAWGYSDASEAAAETDAESRLERIRQRLLSGTSLDKYEYYSDPIREPQLETYENSDGRFAVITRNGYGARVLNTARVMFVDIDAAPPTSFFGRLFGGKNLKDRLLARVEDWINRYDGTGFRIYETPAGLRLIATHDLYDPASDETDALLETVGSDPLYRTLCRTQQCFRARLTAKPWRIGLSRPKVRFAASEAEKAEEKLWCDTYDPKADGYAACRFIKSIGTDSRKSEIDLVVSIHDRESKALSNLPLA